MKIKYAFKGISREIIFTLLVIIQLTFAFSVIYENFSLNSNVSKDSKYISKFFGEYKLYSLKKLDNKTNISKLQDRDIINVFNYLNSSNDFKYVQYCPYNFILQTFNGYNQFKIGSGEYDRDNKKFFIGKSLVINEAFMSTYKISLKKGRLFTAEEMKQEYGNNNAIPIIVGANYEKYYNIGDEVYCIKGGKNICKAKIIGILNKDEYIPGSVESVDERYLNTNNYIITTNSYYGSLWEMVSATFNGNYILFNKNCSQAKIDKDISYIIKIFQDNLNMTVGVKDENQYARTESTIYAMQSKVVLAMSVVIISFVCITLIISLLNSIIKRKTEFGIHILNGGTLTDISLTIYMEVFIMLLFSYILNLPVILHIYKKLDVITLLQEFALLIGLSIIVAAIPIMRIMKLNTSELIKGDE